MTAAPLVRTGWDALPQAFAKLDPRHAFRSPVIFVVVGRLGAHHRAGRHRPLGVLDLGHRLALGHRALREPGRGRRRGPRQGPGRDAAQDAHRDHGPSAARRTAARSRSRGTELRLGDRVVVEAGQVIPGDGDVVEGVATVDESAITGESAPVIRESGGDRCAVTGGTTVLSDRIVVKVTSKPGETFIDRMIALVEGASRQKTPNEIALTILLTTLTLIFLFAVGRHPADGDLLGLAPVAGRARRPARLPHPDDDRRAALRHRHRRHGPPRAAQRARDVRSRGRGRRRRQHPAARQDRHHHLRQPPGERRRARRGRRPARQLLRAAYLSCLADETPEGRSIVDHALAHGVDPRHRVVRRAAPGGRRVRAVLRHRPGCRGVDLPDGTVACARAPARPSPRGSRPAAGTSPRPALRRRRHQRATAAPRSSWRSRSPGQRPHAGRGPPQGRRQAGHARALRPAAADGHPHRDDHRRQPAHRRGHRRRRPGSTTSSPRPPPRTRWP